MGRSDFTVWLVVVTITNSWRCLASRWLVNATRSLYVSIACTTGVRNARNLGFNHDYYKPTYHVDEIPSKQTKRKTPEAKAAAGGHYPEVLLKTNSFSTYEAEEL